MRELTLKVVNGKEGVNRDLNLQDQNSQ